MNTTKIYIGKIPAIIWGKKSDKIYIYVHGKMSYKETAESFAKIAESKGYQTISFDLPEHGERKNEEERCDIWNGIRDLTEISNYVFQNWKSVSLFACSIGVFFSLHAYADKKFENCLFQSPILNMKYLIQQMFIWFDITEEILREEKEISTPVDILSWDYYQNVKEHPADVWNAPTHILYGEKDNLQSLSVMEQFVHSNHCRITISENSEHAFMGSEDDEIINQWLISNV